MPNYRYRRAAMRGRRVFRRRPYYRRRFNANTAIRSLVRAGRASISGHGDYRVNSNSLMLSNDPPTFANVQKGAGFTVCHREFIQNIASASSNGAYGSLFQNNSFRIQPGNVAAFPWLSQIAVNFQEYEINGMVFEFKSLYSDAIATSNTSGALGDIIMATNYNPSNAAFANSIQMMESEFATSGKPSLSKMHPIECLRSQTPVSHLYVISGAVPAGEDAKLYDFGLFQIASEGCQANNALLGQLWVSYEITFYKPILGGNGSGNDIMTDKFQFSGPLSAVPLGTSRTLVPNSTISGTLTSSSYTFPLWVDEGTWLFTYHMSGTTGAAIVAPSIGTTSGVSLGQVFCNTAGFDAVSLAFSPNTAATASKLMMEWIVEIGPNPVLPIVITVNSDGTLPTGSGSGDFIVTQIANVNK